MCVSIICVSSDIIIDFFFWVLFFSRFFLLQKDFEIQKTKTIFYVSSESKSFFFDAYRHERRRRRRRRQKRTRPAKNHLSSFRGGGGGGQKAASPSRLRIENSPPFLRRHRVGIHTHKKREEEISLRSFRFEGHTQQQHRERPTVVVTVPVFFAAFGTRRRSRDHAKPKRGCATQRTTSKTRRWCAWLSLSSADYERRACFLCRRRERFFSFHLCTP